MSISASDDEYCHLLIAGFAKIFPSLDIKGGAEEPFYKAPTSDSNAVLSFRNNYPRSLLHEMAHYCLAGDRRRQIDDFGYWYSPCGRSSEEQSRFEAVEARPQGLEKAMCEILEIKFSPSLDDFSGCPPSKTFLCQLEESYREMLEVPPPTAQKALSGLKKIKQKNLSFSEVP